MSRPIEAIVSIKAMQHNLDQIIKIANGRKIWAVCKAEAYGHGLENAAKAFEKADGIAILDIQDSVRLREYGWKKSILMIEGFFSIDDIPVLQKTGAEVVVHSDFQIDYLRKAAPCRLGIHIKVNTGMNRLGFRPDEVARVRSELAQIEGVEYKGIVSHFANGETSYPPELPSSVSRQIRTLGELAKTEPDVCFSASTGLLFHPEAPGGSVRPGIILYGVTPDTAYSAESLGVIPAQTLRAQIISIQRVNPGEAVGYGSRWIAVRPSRIATVACGYADGYPRSAPSGTPVWTEGKMSAICGRVSMDMLAIDVTDIEEARIGSWVELWGKHVPVSRVAEMSGTIGHELICALKKRVPMRVEP